MKVLHDKSVVDPADNITRLEQEEFNRQLEAKLERQDRKQDAPIVIRDPCNQPDPRWAGLKLKARNQ